VGRHNLSDGASCSHRRARPSRVRYSSTRAASARMCSRSKRRRVDEHLRLRARHERRWHGHPPDFFQPESRHRLLLLPNGRVLYSRWDNTRDAPAAAPSIYIASIPTAPTWNCFTAHRATRPAAPIRRMAPAVLPGLRARCSPEHTAAAERAHAGADAADRRCRLRRQSRNHRHQHYVENNQAVPDTGYPTTTSAEQTARRMTTHADGQRRARALPGGRFNSAFPLWDGTNRVLVSWNQCRLMDATGKLVPCTSANLALAGQANPILTLAPPLTAPGCSTSTTARSSRCLPRSKRDDQRHRSLQRARCPVRLMPAVRSIACRRQLRSGLWHPRHPQRL